MAWSRILNLEEGARSACSHRPTPAAHVHAHCLLGHCLRLCRPSQPLLPSPAMPATRSAAALAGRPHALFEALLRGESGAALSLLETGAAPGAAPPALLLPVGDSAFSALHAAVLGGCPSAIPALVAAGTPVDASLQLPAGGTWAAAAAPLRELFGTAGLHPYHTDAEGTALALAVRWVASRGAELQ